MAVFANDGSLLAEFECPHVKVMKQGYFVLKKQGDFVLKKQQWNEKCRRLQFSLKASPKLHLFTYKVGLAATELGVRRQISSDNEPVEVMAVLGYLPDLLHS